jgi:hypothetical protein
MKLAAALTVLLLPTAAVADDDRLLAWHPRLDVEPAASTCPT